MRASARFCGYNIFALFDNGVKFKYLVALKLGALAVNGQSDLGTI